MGHKIKSTEAFVYHILVSWDQGLPVHYSLNVMHSITLNRVCHAGETSNHPMLNLLTESFLFRKPSKTELLTIQRTLETPLCKQPQLLYLTKQFYINHGEQNMYTSVILD